MSNTKKGLSRDLQPTYWEKPTPTKYSWGILSAATVFFQAHWRRIWLVLLWLAACAAVFTWKFMQYRQRLAFEVMGYCLSTAKGAAETLKLNMAIVLLPICRNTITWMRRSHVINSVIPFNDSINFHKVLSLTKFICVLAFTSLDWSKCCQHNIVIFFSLLRGES